MPEKYPPVYESVSSITIMRAFRLNRYVSLFKERVCDMCSRRFVRLLSWRWQPKYASFYQIGLHGGYLCGHCAKTRHEAKRAVLHLWEQHVRMLVETLAPSETGTVVVPPPARPPLKATKSGPLLN